MKHLAFLSITLFAALAFAQAPATPEKPAAAKEPAKSEAAKPAAEPAKQAAAPSTVRGKPRRWNEDARHCLERPTNTEIIKCAEEFL